MVKEILENPTDTLTRKGPSFRWIPIGIKVLLSMNFAAKIAEKRSPLTHFREKNHNLDGQQFA